MLRALVRLQVRKSRSLAKRNNAGHAFCSGASFTLLMTAEVLWRQSHPTADVKRSGSFGRIKLVRRKRQQIAAQRFDTYVHAAGGLHSIRMKPKFSRCVLSFRAHQRANLFDRLKSADFIVG